MLVLAFNWFYISSLHVKNIMDMYSTMSCILKLICNARYRHNNNNNNNNKKPLFERADKI